MSAVGHSLRRGEPTTPPVAPGVRTTSALRDGRLVPGAEVAAEATAGSARRAREAFGRKSRARHMRALRDGRFAPGAERAPGFARRVREASGRDRRARPMRALRDVGFGPAAEAACERAVGAARGDPTAPSAANPGSGP
jgi:hypothetical protein